jgi:hypothetical protein
MFMRWLPLLKKRFPYLTRIGLMIWPPLYDFCDWSALGIDYVYRIGVDSVRFDYRYSTSIMSMPAVFKMSSWADIPAYTGLPEDMMWSWYAVLRSDVPTRIGFCWRAEENTSPVRTKSLPVEIAEEIVSGLSTTGARLYSLSPERQDLYSSGQFAQPAGLAYESGRMNTWRDTAAYLRTMDFVLTVDTAVAHLCGMLGVPALVLLPVSSCWRWGDPSNRADCPWYGPTMRYYRQSVPFEWDAEGIVRRMKAGLD